MSGRDTEIIPDEQGAEPEGAAASFAPIARMMRSKTVPEHRHSIWYYFGGLALFLLLVMIGSGLLLTTYYEPSAGPAVNPDGTPLAAAIVTQGVEWRGQRYEPGDV